MVQVNYIWFEMLYDVSDVINNVVVVLFIFCYYYIQEDQLYVSVDGQKFEIYLEIFKIWYFFKYFGINKGIMVMILVVNYSVFNVWIIGFNEYELYYIYDLL